MSQVKVMISRFYNGGAWQDAKTGTIFDPRKDSGSIFTFSPRMDLSGIAESIRKNHLVPLDQLSAIEFQRMTKDAPVVTPQIVEVRGKLNSLEVVFDRPVYPRPGKAIHVPTRTGVVNIPVVDAYMEDYRTAIFAVDANAPVQIDAGAFVDDDGVLSEAYPVEVKEVEPEPTPEPVVEEVKVEVEEVKEEAPKKKAPARKKTTKKAE